MAKVTGPLLSQSAAGTYADALVFRSGNAPQTCRKLGRRTVALSAAQQLHHATFSMLSSAWSTASESDKLSWSPLAAVHNITDYAAYIQFNFARIADGLATTTIYPPADTPTIVLTMAAGSPAASPDCTGDYVVIGEWESHPLYARFPDYRFCIQWDTDNKWRIYDITDPDNPFLYWYKTDPISGIYSHSPPTAGHPVATLL